MLSTITGKCFVVEQIYFIFWATARTELHEECELVYQVGFCELHEAT